MELDFDPNKIDKSLFSFGLIPRLSGEYRINEDITVKPRLTFGNETYLAAFWTYQFTKKLRILYSEEFNLNNLFSKDPIKQSQFMNYGVIFEFTI